MPRARCKRKCVVVATSRAPKRNRTDPQYPPIVGEVLKINDHENHEEVVEERDGAELAAEEIRAVCEALIRQTFSAIGMDVDSYLACFNACVEKAISNAMVYATAWSKWGGYRDLLCKMAYVADLCQTTGKLHCPTAPAIVMAYTLLRICKVTTRAAGGLPRVMEICKTLECAAPAIRHYEDHPDVILRLPDSFEPPEEWPAMVYNNVTEQGGQVAKVDTGCLDIDKKHRGQLLLKLKDLEASDAVDSDQTYKVEVSRTVTRQEAQQVLQSIIEPLRELETPESSLFDHLTLPRLKVLPVGDKRLILWWIKDIKPEIFAEWRKETEQDIEQYQWTETVKGKLPETWADHPADTVFKRIEERAKTDPDPSNIKDLVLLKEIFKDQERQGMDPAFCQKMTQWMLRREHKADEQAATIAKLHKKLDLVDEQAAEQAAASAKVLKRLDLVLAKLGETSEPMTEDAESLLGDSLVDFTDAKSPLFINE
ncbi:uncharacterized protein TrAtP1_007085 [Trichoderma atroviride]|uniref:Uncharacterized protein n=1 Tax=Hypocrea atroviridis (strain ATCC 20476 / IMI 206040) TaxID=452589 RepID=G9PC60_HYPAI|nr:uncharacterized protein TRIATDRAFT_279220 [Trichoderma atroviride IMI 206040]EHK39442.1 hypothetical protein TRIATDRAFT_279220 [Trichoderma atroviride IMI 206040]UKZ65897.1 hypothetical protein TrAtP1_007085 [Trichoderma atroviride]